MGVADHDEPTTLRGYAEVWLPSEFGDSVLVAKGPHQVAEAIVDVVDRADRNGDKSTLITCLKLCKVLTVRVHRLDDYCRNAVWTSLLESIETMASRLTPLYESVDAAILDDLFWPHTLPHHIFGCRLIRQAHELGRYTVASAAEERVRDVTKPGVEPPRYVDVSLGVAPSHGDQDIRFESCIDRSKQVPLWLVGCIWTTIRDELTLSLQAGKALGGLSIRLIDAGYHYVDTAERHLVRATRRAFQAVLERAKLVPIVEK